MRETRTRACKARGRPLNARLLGPSFIEQMNE